MILWSAEIKELERVNEPLKGQFPELGKELIYLIKTEDENVTLLYSRRCLEVIITDLCECELKRSRGTEPLKGIIDKLNKEEKVPANIVASMHGLNTLSTFGTHPKDFDPEQVKPALSNLAIILKWYLKYKGIEALSKPTAPEEEITVGTGKQTSDVTKLEKSVAILPFRNDSKDEENTYFINGLMEEILNNLQKIRDLRVISRTSVEQYRNQTKPISEIAKELEVNYIVEGSGQKYGNSFRLRTQLIMATRESHLWGESYQQKISDVEDIFRIQSQIAESIATELKAIITPQEKDLIEKIPTKELEAYDAYLKGHFFWRKITPNDFDIAMQYFETAKEKDPKYALAYAGICDVWIGRQQMGFASPAEAGPKAYEAVMKALELDNNRAEVHYSLALMKTWGMWNWEEGEEEFKKTIKLNPNFAEAHAHYAHLLNILGRHEEALEYGKASTELDPFNPILKALYAADLMFIHKFEESILINREVLKMDPMNLLALNNLALSLHFAGKYDEVLEPYKLFLYTTYKDAVHVIDKDYANKEYSVVLNHEADTLAAQSKSIFIMPSDIFCLYICAGNKEKALEWLEIAYQGHDPGIIYLQFPWFDSLRDEPRFQEIAREMKLPYK
jgi:TolB-like protein